MTQVYVMEAKSREQGGKGVARRLRNEGYVPAVVYGSNMEPKKVAVTAHSLQMAIQKGGFLTTPQELSIEGKAEKVLPREIQTDPLTDRISHVDFLRFDPKRIVKAEVRLEMTDLEKSPGVKKGGVATLARTEIELLCRADSIPQVIYVSMAGLDVGHAAKFSSIELPEGVKPVIEGRDFTLASVLGTRTSTMADLAAKGAAGEGSDDEESEE